MANDKQQWLKWISEVQALAQAGLTYTDGPFDKERYLRLRDLSAEMAAQCSQQSPDEIKHYFAVQEGYATPKIDVRAFLLKDNKVLLAKERRDGLWTLPGGWADTNESPSETAVRETKEETGYNVRAIRLLALWDKQKHDHPPEWPHAYKCFFHCEMISGTATENLEVAEIDFFELDQLPPLSTPRVTASQIRRLYELVLHQSPTQCD